MVEPGVVMYWFGADLYYANANHFVEQAHRLVNEAAAPVRWLVVDAGAITGIDFSAAARSWTSSRTWPGKGSCWPWPGLAAACGRTWIGRR